MIKNALPAFLLLLSACPAFSYEALVVTCHDGDTVRVRRIVAEATNKQPGESQTDENQSLCEQASVSQEDKNLNNLNDLSDLNETLKSTPRKHIRTSIENTEKIRLAGIDAPELAQPFGIESRNYLEQMILGKVVEVEERSLDRYGRTVAELTTTGGIDVNHRLVQKGFAWCYPSFAKKDKKLFTLEARAKASSAGLWSEPNPEPPWVFRKQMASTYPLDSAE